MLPDLLPNVVYSALLRPGGTVGDIRPQSIPHVSDGTDAGRQGNLFPFQPSRIPCSLPFLVMAVRDVKRLAEVREGREQLIPMRRVFLHHHSLFVGEWARF